MASNITPYLCVDGAAQAIEYYKSAFGAKETLRLDGPGGRIMHAEISIDGATVMLADEFPDWGFVSPGPDGARSSQLHLLVRNVDQFVATAVALGAKLERPVQDQFYGIRSGSIRDPFGHRWTIGTEIEKLTNEEIKARAAKMTAGRA